MNPGENALLETIRQIVRQEMKCFQGASLAVVQETHTGEGEYACTLRLHDSDILLKQVPVATPRLGQVSIPAVNDMVLVAFIAGDMRHPVVIGSLYNDEDRPPAHSPGQSVYQLPLGAGDGEGLAVTAAGVDTTSVEMSIGRSLVISLKDDDPVVSIDVASGAATVTIDSDGALSIKGSRGVNFEAGSDLKLKAANIHIEASAEVNIKGAVINLN